MDLSQALSWAGELDRMAAVIALADNRAKTLGNRRLQARVQMQEIELGRSKGQSPSQLEEQTRPIVKLFEELHDDRALADALVVQSFLVFDQGRVAEAFKIASRAGIHAERSGNRVAGSNALDVLQAAFVYGPVPVSEAVGACLARLEQGLPTRYDERGLLSCLARLLAMAGRFAEARTAFAERQLLIEEEVSPAIHEAVGQAEAAAEVDMLAGDPSAAEGELRSGVEILEGMGDWAVLSTQLAWLAAAIFEQGRLDEGFRSRREASSWLRATTSCRRSSGAQYGLERSLPRGRGRQLSRSPGEPSRSQTPPTT